MVDSLFGGRGLATGPKDNRRTSLASSENLVVGDIFLGRTSSSRTIFIYLGDNLFYSLATVNLTVDSISADTRLERGPGYAHYYVIVRPSYAFD